MSITTEGYVCLLSLKDPGSGDAKQNALSNRGDSASRVTMLLSTKPWGTTDIISDKMTYGEGQRKLVTS